jgi:hypothetical protein
MTDEERTKAEVLEGWTSDGNLALKLDDRTRQ